MASDHQSPRGFGFDTLSVHAGQAPDPTTGARATPIYQTASFVFKDADQAVGLFNIERAGHVYSRLSNPTNAVLEERIAALDGGVGAIAAASGQAAMHLAIATICSAGDHIVASRSIYGGTHNLLAYTLPRFGIQTTFVDPRNVDAFVSAIRPNTKLVFGEILGNPGLEVMNVPAVATAVHACGLPLLIDEVVAASARRAQAKHLRLLPFVDPAVPGRLQGDPSRLAQVLANLLGNAIKFTERGEIRVEARPDPEVLGGVRLIVDDTGVGIPREAQATIFDPFTQIDGSSTRRHGGTGLGLALVRQQVELMGGRLKLESAPGSGSRFEFTLVLRQAGEDAPPPPQTVLLAAGPSPYRAALVACLQRAGAQLSVASTGEVASRVTGPLDAMLIDTAWPADEQDALARSAAACGARLAAIVIDADSVPAPMLAASALVRIHAPIAFAAVSDFLHPRASAAGGLPARSQHVLESVVESLQECLGGPAFAALVDTFCETVSQRLADYREAVASGDRERLQQLTHALKGVTANVGAQRLATLCAALGQQSEDGPLEDGHDLLVAEFAAVVKQLRAIAADAPPRQRALV